MLEMIHDGGACGTAVMPDNKHRLFQQETLNKAVLTGKSRMETVNLYGCISASLTGGVCSDVNDLAFRSVDLMLVRRGELGFDHDGVLRPRFQRSDQVPRLFWFFAGSRARRGVNVCNHPAV